MHTHHYINNTDTLESAYTKLVDKGFIDEDSAQQSVVQTLAKLQTTLKGYDNHPHLLKRLLPHRHKKIKGIYLYGDVGRGKSMLMDLFFETTHVEKKRRVHFHAFMIEIHEKLFAWRQTHQHTEATHDPLPLLAKAIAEEVALLCFDELQVTDIADAMILERLVTALLNEGVVIVATSNRIPDDLYKDGLQRENFLPFIELIKERMQVVLLSAQCDYRMQHLQSLACVYKTPLGKDTDKFLADTFSELTNSASFETTQLEVQGRTLTLEKTYGDIAWASFEELCKRPLSANDYIEISRSFSTLLLSDIPQLTAEDRNEAKRFVTLIDELYEHKVKLICTAQTPPDQLYVAGTGSFEFQRTVSRLMEMQTQKYFQLAHLS